MIDRGRVVAEGTLGELKRAASSDVIRLKLAGGEAAVEVDPVAVEKLAAAPLVEHVRADGEDLRVYVEDGERALPTVSRILDETGARPQTVVLSRASLDDVFLHHTGRAMSD